MTQQGKSEKMAWEFLRMLYPELSDEIDEAMNKEAEQKPVGRYVTFIEDPKAFVKLDMGHDA